MFWFQDLARQHTHKPVALSSLVQLPSIVSAFAFHEQIAIFTANSCTLEPMHDLIARECGLEVTDNRFVIVGCQNVPGFEAVERGEKVDTEYVQPGIVLLAKQVIAEYPGTDLAFLPALLCINHLLHRAFYARPRSVTPAQQSIAAL